MDFWNGEGNLPPVGTVCYADAEDYPDADVKIKAHTRVGGKPAAIWQFYFQVSYGFEGDFKPIPENEQ